MNAQNFIDALRAIEEHRDFSPMLALYADDCETSNPSDRRPHRGRDGAERFWHAYRAAFKDVHSDFRAVVEGDDKAILEWTSRGRNAHGEDFEYDGVSVVELEDGKIRRFRAYFDPADIAPAVNGNGKRAPRGRDSSSPSGTASSPSGA